MFPLKTSERSTIETNPKLVVPRSSNVRSRVHEYGGGAARVHGGFAYWSEFNDGRIYRRQLSRGGDGGIEAVTPGRWWLRPDQLDACIPCAKNLCLSLAFMNA